jgi:cytochrome c5
LKSREQNFFDIFMLLVGIYVGTMISIVVFSNFTSQDHSEISNSSNSDRIMPIGQFALLGDSDIGQLIEPDQNTKLNIEVALLSGTEVYNQACSLCHQSPGVAGAPVFGDISAWAPRVLQGTNTLQDHAINGYTGESGYMPPKGGRLDLSDDEIILALNFMLESV